MKELYSYDELKYISNWNNNHPNSQFDSLSPNRQTMILSGVMFRKEAKKRKCLDTLGKVDIITPAIYLTAGIIIGFLIKKKK